MVIWWWWCMCVCLSVRVCVHVCAHAYSDTLTFTCNSACQQRGSISVAAAMWQHHEAWHTTSNAVAACVHRPHTTRTQGRSLGTPAYTHALETGHHMYMKLDNGKVGGVGMCVHVNCMYGCMPVSIPVCA